MNLRVKKLIKDDIVDICLDIALFSVFTFALVLIAIIIGNVLWFLLFEPLFLVIWFGFKMFWRWFLIEVAERDLNNMSIYDFQDFIKNP